VITKRGKPVAKLIPFSADSADLIGSLKHKVRINAEILSTGMRWNAERGHARSSVRRRRHAESK
jgi:antitoxin (DNA-binding transcriptional repressor) of toxin-antitoxin stability system